jgi:hemoglobin/transferrin/lactoferrin receptor protein
MFKVRTRRIALRLCAIAACGSLPAHAAAQGAQAPPAASSQPPEATPARFFDAVTVSATLAPVLVGRTPATVSVIDDAAIARRMIENTADLVKFEPGVYVDANMTRVGLNGFNIRGIGGNRVMTRVDGVETSEQFDFGPFNVHQFALDLDTLRTAEIVRSSASSLYGSDALGGVVSFFTKDPADYLSGQRRHAGAKLLFDGRSRDASGNGVVAFGTSRVQASVFGSYGRGEAGRNRGMIIAADNTRTAPNPQRRSNAQALGKVVAVLGEGNRLRGTVEIADNTVRTDAYSSYSRAATGASVTSVTGVVSHDDLQRRRYSVDQALDNRGGLNHLAWNLYVQRSATGQLVDEVRTTTSPSAATALLRAGSLEYEQDTVGGSLQARRLFDPFAHPLLVTAGGSYKRDTFDMLRDRVDVDRATGAVVPPVNLILPSKYFPTSTVGEGGGYLQGEWQVGRLTVLPGLRYDRFTLDADERDQVFIDNENPAAVDFSADRVTVRLGASLAVTTRVSAHVQYAGGFRAPPFSAVNSGFANLSAGYVSLPNTALRPETSDNLEASLRASFSRVSAGVTVFNNHFDDFILQAQRGFNSTTGLLEFQYQNVSAVRIRGVELRAETHLSRDLQVRAAYAAVRGDDVTGDTDVPISTVAPDQGTLGLQYDRGGRWGAEAIGRVVRAQRPSVAGAGFFAPGAFATGDVTAWLRPVPDVTLRLGLLNATNARYFVWSNVRGRQAADPAIDRYSSPGISVIVSAAYGW